jgi:hypothetical protein
MKHAPPSRSTRTGRPSRASRPLPLRTSRDPEHSAPCRYGNGPAVHDESTGPRPAPRAPRRAAACARRSAPAARRRRTSPRPAGPRADRSRGKSTARRSARRRQRRSETTAAARASARRVVLSSAASGSLSVAPAARLRGACRLACGPADRARWSWFAASGSRRSGAAGPREAGGRGPAACRRRKRHQAHQRGEERKRREQHSEVEGALAGEGGRTVRGLQGSSFGQTRLLLRACELPQGGQRPRCANGRKQPTSGRMRQPNRHQPPCGPAFKSRLDSSTTARPPSPAASTASISQPLVSAMNI